jgi:hypothetical protein
MIDTSIVRLHQQGYHKDTSANRREGHAAVLQAKSTRWSIEWSTDKACVERRERHEVRLVGKLLFVFKSGSMLLAGRGYDADWNRELAIKKSAWANIPPKSNRSDPICSSRTSIGLVTSSNGSATGSSSAVRWRRAATGSQELPCRRPTRIYLPMAGRAL